MKKKKLDTSIQSNSETQSELLFRTRSEEMQEIIGRMPVWIIRWGITVIGLVVLAVFIGSALIKVPDVVHCKVILAPVHAPVILYATNNSQIKELLVKEGDFVEKGSLLAILDYTIADYNTISEAKQIAQSIDTSTHINQTLEKLSVKELLFLRDLQYLYVDLIISVKEYLQNKPLKDQKYKQQQEIRFSARKLMTACENWEKKYLITSMVSGQVNFLRTLHINSSVKADEAIMAIVRPESKSTVTGNISTTIYSKVKERQTVWIKLDDYPLPESGMLKGSIVRLSDIPVNNTYMIEIILDSGLITNTGQRIPCKTELQGAGEIILQEKSILEKLLENTAL